MAMLDWIAYRAARYVIAPIMCRLGVHVTIGCQCSWCGVPSEKEEKK